MTKNRRAKQDARKLAAAQNKPYAQAFREASEEHSWKREHEMMDRKRSEFMELFATGCDVNVTHSINSAEDIDRAIGMIAAAKRQMAHRVQSVRKASLKATSGDSFWASSKAKGELVANPILITLQGFDPDDDPTGDEVVDQLSDALRDDLTFIMRSGKEYGVTVMKVAAAAGPGTKIHLRHSSNGTAPNPRMSFMDTLITKMKSKDSFTIRVELSEPDGIQNAIDLINCVFEEVANRWRQPWANRGLDPHEELRLLSMRKITLITEGFSSSRELLGIDPHSAEGEMVRKVLDSAGENLSRIDIGRRAFVDCWSVESSTGSPAMVFEYSKDADVLNENSVVPLIDSIMWENERKKVARSIFALHKPVEGVTNIQLEERSLRVVGLIVASDTLRDRSLVTGLLVNWKNSKGGWSNTAYVIHTGDRNVEAVGLLPLQESALLKSAEACRVAAARPDYLDALQAEYAKKFGGKTTDDYPALSGWTS